MTAQELFDALFVQYNAGFWHSIDHNCDINCPQRPIDVQPEGYAELKINFKPYGAKYPVKAGTTLRFTHASNLGCLDGSQDLNRPFGYTLRIEPDDSILTNCRLTKEK